MFNIIPFGCITLTTLHTSSRCSFTMKDTLEYTLVECFQGEYEEEGEGT